MLTPTPLTDEEVLETFQNMNDVIRMRMITIEVLPSPMRKYRIGKYVQFYIQLHNRCLKIFFYRKWQNLLFNKKRI
jgi:hypothetical protein